MAENFDPWDEIVLPAFPDLVLHLKPSKGLVDRLYASRLVDSAEMRALTQQPDEEERARMLLSSSMQQTTDTFLLFCKVLQTADNESQQRLGCRLRNAFDNKKGLKREDFSPSQSDVGHLELEQLSTGNMSSTQSETENHVTVFVPPQPAARGCMSSVKEAPVKIVKQVTSSTVSTMVVSNVDKVEVNMQMYGTPRRDHVTLLTDKDRLYEGYRPWRGEQFVGRNDLVKSLTATLRDSHNTIMVLGPPGIGKTSVANAVCLEYESIGRCDWIQLHDQVETIDDVYSLCCRWITGTIDHVRDVPQRVFRALPSNSVIVVDACEKTTPSIISTLLREANTISSGQLRFLLTSQVAMNKHQLELPSLYQVQLPPLNEEDSLQVLLYNREMISENVSTDMKAVGKLLHGIPLALSLASVMFCDLEYTPRTLLAKLQTEGFSSSLSSDSDDLGKGMRTVLVNFFASIRDKAGCREYHAALLASIFPGTISQEAFDHVCDLDRESGPPELGGAIASPKLIADLKKWHVLERCPPTDESNPRYQMHAYIKEYASSVLNDCDNVDLLRTVKELFLAYFAKLLQKMAKQEQTRQSLLDTGGLFALDRELENISGFLTYLTDGQTFKQGSAKVAKLVLDVLIDEEVGHLLSLRFSHDKRLHTLRCVHSCVKTSGSPQVKAGLLLEMSKILRGLARFDEALKEVTEACRLCRQSATDKEREAGCLEVQGSIYFRQHRSGFVDAEASLKDALKLARENLTEALEKYQSSDSVRKCTKRVASICKTLGELFSRQRRPGEAIALFDEAESCYRQSTGREVLSHAWLMHRIGNHYQTEHQFDKAEKAFLEGLDLCNKYRAEKDAVYAKLNFSLGRLYQYHDDKSYFSKSLMRYEKAQSVQETLNAEHPDLVQTYIGIGRVRNDMKRDPGETLRLFEKAQNILDDAPRKSGESDYPMAELCLARSMTYRQLHKFQEELESVKRAYDIYNKSSDKGYSLDIKKANCMRDMGHAYRRLGRGQESAKCFKEERRLRPKGKGRRK